MTLKLVFLLALFFFTGPVVTHALAQACLHEDIQPMLAEDRRGRGSSRRRRSRTTGGSHRSLLINAALLTLLAVVTVAIVCQRNLFGVVVLTSIYSFLMASVLIVLDAVDVAMTEASVGAGISTVILLATLHLIKTTEMRSVRHAPAAVVRRGRHRRRPGLGHARAAAVRHAGCADPQACRAALPRRHDQGHQRSERRDLGAGRLSRLRHARRDDGDLHRRHRRDAAAARRDGEAAPTTRRGER